MNVVNIPIKALIAVSITIPKKKKYGAIVKSHHIQSPKKLYTAQEFKTILFKNFHW